MLIFAVSTTLVAVTAIILSARLAEGSVVQLLVGAYVVAFAEIVLLSLLLSIGSAFSRWAVFASVLAVFGVVLATSRGASLPSVRSAASTLRGAARDPVIGVLVVVVLGVIGYSLALGLFRPPNDADALEYHLARAAFWIQQGGIGYINGARDVRLDSFPPNGEIPMAFTMVLSSSSRVAPVVQLVAACATAVALCGIARRIGLGVRAAVFAGLVFMTLPVVALQASTALNDVTVSSLVASSAYFLLRRTWPNLLLGGISVGLLVGSKLTALFALPVLAAIMLTAHRRQSLRVLSVSAVSVIAGAYWYVVNRVEAAGPLGGGVAEQHPNSDAVTVVGRITRTALASIELPGAIGLDRLLYVAAAALLVAIAFTTAQGARERVARCVIAASATLAPLALVPIGELLLRGNQKLFYELGRPDAGYLDSDRSATKASPTFSWYGPLGVLLTLLSVVLVFRAVRGRRLPAVALILAAAPLIWLLLIGVFLPYTEWNGRYLMGGAALGAATWGLVLRFRPLAWATAAIALLTTTLAFVHQHDRPSGLRLIEPTSERSVWTQPDLAVQATDHLHWRALIGYVDRNVPSHARLALQPYVWPGGGKYEGGDLPPFPFFGPGLSRTIVFADSVRDAEQKRADWAILRKDRLRECSPGWSIVFRYDVWVVLRRVSNTGC